MKINKSINLWRKMKNNLVMNLKGLETITLSKRDQISM